MFASERPKRSDTIKSKKDMKKIGNKGMKHAKDELEVATNWQRSFI